jgi:hypothetical protein
MINPNREITPEDFAWDRERVFWTDVDGGRAKREYERELKETECLYHLQEEAKAKAHFQREQARKELIPYSEPWLLRYAVVSALGSSSSTSAKIQTCPLCAS